MMNLNGKSGIEGKTPDKYLTVLLQDAATGRYEKIVARLSPEDVLLHCLTANSGATLTVFDLTDVVAAMQSDTDKLFAAHQQRADEIGRVAAMMAWTRFRTSPRENSTRRGTLGHDALVRLAEVLARTAVDVNDLSLPIKALSISVSSLWTAVDGLLRTTSASAEALVASIAIEEALGDGALVTDETFTKQCDLHADILRDCMRSMLGVTPFGFHAWSSIYDICLRGLGFHADALLLRLGSPETMQSLIDGLIKRRSRVDDYSGGTGPRHRVEWPVANDALVVQVQRLALELDKFLVIRARLDAWRDGRLTGLVDTADQQTFEDDFRTQLLSSERSVTRGLQRGSR